MLGITISFPKPVYEKDGDSASATVTGMVVEIDMGPLKQILNQLPLADLIDMLPEQAGQLKDGLGLVMGLSSRVVVSLANAAATVDTVAPIEPPTVEPDRPRDRGAGRSRHRGRAPDRHAADHHSRDHRPGHRHRPRRPTTSTRLRSAPACRRCSRSPASCSSGASRWRPSPAATSARWVLQPSAAEPPVPTASTAACPTSERPDMTAQTHDGTSFPAPPAEVAWEPAPAASPRPPRTRARRR